MKNRAVVRFLLLVAFAGSIFCMEQVGAASQIVILSNSGYVAVTGSYYIVGEVQNTGSTAVSYVKITSTYYNSDNSVVATEFGFAELLILLPCRKSPFKIMLLDENQAAKVDHYSFAVSSASLGAAPPQQALKILSHNSYIDLTGALYVVGELQNMGTIRSTFNKVIATFYNSNGTVVGEELTFTDPADIEPGGKAPFEVLCIEYDRVPLMCTYSLTAESSEYACILEFLSSDLNRDGVVNIFDITMVAKAFGSRQGDPNRNDLADLDKNGTVSILDISLVAKDFGKKTVLHTR